MPKGVLVPKVEVDDAVYGYVNGIVINTNACRMLLTKAGLPAEAISVLTIAAIDSF